ncbi:AraC-like DNA-binding protein [Curtobacterium luteum]|uniref:AraC-like DNA-binding protein n=1 Tax=Curtobacterium luteum TaxID=33881 RepID=A0ABS2RQT9_9MICO|nr:MULTISPECIES: AraC family transcriptional regulator [Curtobacterium]MBM7801380.1 AraC-like DNA-binding protein [Curtobacterium luteum]NUU49876.1 AraC family transcriptional regulator [Curtobacterium luteum]
MSTASDAGPDLDPRSAFDVAGSHPDEAVRLYEEAYDGAGFSATRTDRTFGFRFKVVGDDTMTFRSTRFDGRMSGEVEVRDEYVVMWTAEGGGLVDVGRDEVAFGPRTPMMFPTGRPFVFDLADLRQSLVQIDREYLERVAAEVHGTQPGALVFDHAHTPDTEDLRAWNAHVQRAARIVLGPAPLTPLALAETTRQTAQVLLRTFPHTVLAPDVPLPQGATGRVRSAIEFMHAFAHTPITTTDVAEHVGLSVRGLQQAFQRQVGTAPNAMLRGIRLDRIHEELRRARPGDTTVAAVAVRWGFAHLGRFSAAYARRFDEYPRDTLQN